ncbi:conserved oligomeric Golgi complex subunit 8-like isoform X5 [Artemia franciscana]
MSGPSYEESIKNFNLKEILSEKNRLAEEKRIRTDRLQELAYQNYEIFIRTGNALDNADSELCNLTKSSHNLSDHLTVLSDRCHQFSKKWEHSEEKRRKTILTLAKHSQIMDLLEVPQTMQKFVRDGAFEDALHLAEEVKKMESKIGNILVAQKIYKEVEEQRLAMLSSLISQLRGPIQLSQCIHIIGYLRRLEVYSEAELRLKFLQSRNFWLQSTLDSIQSDSSYQLVLQIIQLTRQNLFDIVNQYRALFNLDDPLLLIEGTHGNCVNETAILPQWLSYRIRIFIGKLKEILPNIPSESLDTIVYQCMHFGMSFGRKGADFRDQLVSVFLTIFSDKFTEKISKAKHIFKENLENWDIQEAVRSVSTPATIPQSAESLSPSSSLVAYSPLAELCNAFVPAFNDIRISPPLAIYNNILNILSEALKFAADQLLAFYRGKVANASPEAKDFFQLMCVEFRDNVIGFLESSVGLLYPAQEVSKYSGMTIMEIQNQRSHKLDRTGITSILAEFLPELTTEEEEVRSQEKEKLEENDQTMIEDSEAETVGKESSKIQQHLEKTVTSS